MSLLTKMRMLTRLTSTEELLVNFILQEPKSVMQMSASEVAEAAYVSLSTIYRLLNKLGIKGWTEFHFLLAQEESEKHDLNVDYDFPILPENTEEEIFDRMQCLYQETTETTRLGIEKKHFDKAVSLLANAEVIDIYTSAGNVFFAKNFQFQMQEINRSVRVPTEEYQQLLAAANSCDTHVALLISYEGRGRNIRRVGDILNEKEIPMVVLTSASKNPIHDLSTTHLYLSPLENHYYKQSSYGTRLSLLYLLDVLYAGIFHKNYHQNINKKLTNYHYINPGKP